MYPEDIDEWHQHEDECNLPEVNWLDVCTEIAYGTSFTKKDLLEYNKIFEGLHG